MTKAVHLTDEQARAVVAYARMGLSLERATGHSPRSAAKSESAEEATRIIQQAIRPQARSAV